MPATAGTWQPRQVAFGRVEARREVTLALPFASRVTSLPVEPGAKVESGAVLARFEAPVLRGHVQAWSQARRIHEVARERAQGLREALGERTVTRREVAAGEQAAAEAEDKLQRTWEALVSDLERLNLPADPDEIARRVTELGLASVARELSRLQAPFDGIVIGRFATEGEQLVEGAEILELETLDRVYIDVGVSRAELAQWAEGESRWIDGALRIGLEPLSGTPRYDPDSGLWLLRFEARGADVVLWDGAWVEVEHLGPPRPVVWVPSSAVVARNGKTWCIVRDQSDLRPAPVRVGPAAGDSRIPVLDGLEPGTHVVTEGAYELLYRDLKELIRFED